MKEAIIRQIIDAVKNEMFRMNKGDLHESVIDYYRKIEDTLFKLQSSFAEKANLDIKTGLLLENLKDSTDAREVYLALKKDLIIQRLYLNSRIVFVSTNLEVFTGAWKLDGRNSEKIKQESENCFDYFKESHKLLNSLAKEVGKINSARFNELLIKLFLLNGQIIGAIKLATMNAKLFPGIEQNALLANALVAGEKYLEAIEVSKFNRRLSNETLPSDDYVKALLAIRERKLALEIAQENFDFFKKQKTYTLLIQALWENKNFEKAISIAKKNVEQFPCIEAYTLLARSLMLSGKKTAIQSAYDGIKCSNNTRTYNHLIEALYLNGKVLEAIDFSGKIYQKSAEEIISSLFSNLANISQEIFETCEILERHSKANSMPIGEVSCEIENRFVSINQKIENIRDEYDFPVNNLFDMLGKSLLFFKQNELALKIAKNNFQLTGTIFSVELVIEILERSGLHKEIKPYLDKLPQNKLSFRQKIHLANFYSATNQFDKAFSALDEAWENFALRPGDIDYYNLRNRYDCARIFLFSKVRQIPAIFINPKMKDEFRESAKRIVNETFEKLLDPIQKQVFIETIKLIEKYSRNLGW